MKYLVVFVALLLSITFSNCDNSNSPPPPDDEVVKEIDESGGTITWKDVTVDIPENALSGEATITLRPPDYNPEDSLDVMATTEPVFITIDGAVLQDSIFMTLPGFIADSEWNMVGFETGGIWQLLEIVEETPGNIRVVITPELFDQGQYTKGLLKSPSTITGGTVIEIEGESLKGFPKEISLLPDSTLRPSDPAIVLIHGALSDNSRWKDDFVSHMSNLGEVYKLEYPWRNTFVDQLPEMLDKMNQRFGDRDIYLVGHSKGGIVARAIIRLNETGSYGLNIKKALFYGTPHYGASLANLACINGFGHVYCFLDEDIFQMYGIAECREGSPELDEINQPLVFQKCLPMY